MVWFRRISELMEMTLLTSLKVEIHQTREYRSINNLNWW